MLRTSAFIFLAITLFLAAYPALRLSKVPIPFFDSEPLGIVAAALCVIFALAIILMLVRDGVCRLFLGNRPESSVPPASPAIGDRNIQASPHHVVIALFLLIASCPATGILADFNGAVALAVPALMIAVGGAILFMTSLDVLRGSTARPK